MKIECRRTPNPNARKFVLPQKYFTKPLNFSSVEAAATHPLAHCLFELGDIYNVFMVQDFVTVNKFPDVDWEGLEARVQTILNEYIAL